MKKEIILLTILMLSVIFLLSFQNVNSAGEHSEMTFEEYCMLYSKCGDGVCDSKDIECNCSRDCVNNSNKSDRKSLYWFDDTTKVCGQKEFCGMYMYYGLQTFESKTQCEKALYITERNITNIKNEIKENIKERKELRNKFKPWQKRNESECPEGCKCIGAVVTCETEEGKTITITAGNSGKIITMEINKIRVDTTLEFETQTENNKTKLILNLPDGKNITLKVMPERAAEKIKEKLKEMNYTIELKQVTITKNNKTKIVYEAVGEKHGRFLGLFKTKGKIITQVDAETGEVIFTKKPWWSFLATKI